MQLLAIIIFSVGAAVLYGIVHDEMTVRVCVEYFSVFHPPLVPTNSPTLLALGWGVIATWWVGLPLGIVLALAARVGPWPKWGVGQLVRPVAVLLTLVLMAAFAAGVCGYGAAVSGDSYPPWWVAEQLAPAKWPYFVADLWAHRTSYLAGGVGGIGLSAWVATMRYRERAT